MKQKAFVVGFIIIALLISGCIENKGEDNIDFEGNSTPVISNTTTPAPTSTPILSPSPTPTPEPPEWFKAYSRIDFSDLEYPDGKPCLFYSKKTVTELRMQGYNAYCITFRTEKTEPPITHIMVYVIDSWVQYILEPQTGQFWIYYSEEFEDWIRDFIGYYPEIRRVWLPQ